MTYRIPLPAGGACVPILRTTWVAFRRGGLGEVWAALVRFIRRRPDAGETISAASNRP